jgi:four helix bundle protein
MCESLPSEEKYGIKSQLQRAAVSVSTNIAEGAGRNNKGEFNQFLGIAQGSLCEVESLLLLCVRLDLFNESETEVSQKLILKIHNMLLKLKLSLNK